MNIRNLDTVIFALAMAAIYLAVGLHAWRRRTVPGASALAVICLAAGAYAVFYLLQLDSQSLAGALFWYNLSLPGASILGPAWLVFAIQYSQQNKILTRPRLLLLGLIPVVTCLVAWTNALHGLYGTDFSFDPLAAWPVLEWKFGLFYWINFGYAYLTTALGALILVSMAYKRWRFFNRQTAFLLIGILLPILLNVVFVLAGYTPIPHLDLTPFSFLFTAVCWSLAIFRFRFLDIVPIARDRVFETMPTGVIALDQLGRVIDVNPAAIAMLDLSPTTLLGQNLPAVVDVFQTPGSQLPAGGEHKEICLGPENQARYFHLHLAPLFSRGHQSNGSLLLFEDITQRKKAELAEQEQRMLADTIRSATADLNRTLKLEEVLDLVLGNMSRIVPYTSAHIVLLDKSGQKALSARFRVCEPLLSPTGNYGMHSRLEPGCPAAALMQMYENAKPFHLPDDPAHFHCASCLKLDNQREWVRDSVAVPMRVYGSLVGFAIVDSTVPGHFSQMYMERLDAFIGQAAIAVENARLYEELAEQAIRDELTGAFNRRGFLALAQRELDRARQVGLPCSVVLFDLDHFKEINDSLGHAAGDQVLRTVVRKCQGNIRDGDALGRYGGDEFCLVLPDCDVTIARQVCERLRKAIDGHLIRTKNGQCGVTISMGIAVDATGQHSLAELLNYADRAMYAAKEAGRNCVCWEEFTPTAMRG